MASLAAVATEVAEYHEAALSDAKLQVEIVGDVSGEFDLPLFKRALSNLLGNASRYADPGTAVRIEIGEMRPGLVRVVVINRGELIGAEHLPRLFDRFYRADTSRSESHSHNGLGLSIVAAIARMHGGRPLAQSGERTTTVGLLLPTR